jgi:hypothetical protein
MHADTYASNQHVCPQDLTGEDRQGDTNIRREGWKQKGLR